MEVGGKRVDLKKITMPLLNYYGKYDHLVPPEACEVLTSKVGSKDAEDICLDTGHIGIYVSSKCQKEFAPRIARWLKERDEDKKKRGTKKATPKKRAAKKTPKKTKSALKTKKNQ
jgi:polyhydroxyalkanoate synthase